MYVEIKTRADNSFLHGAESASVPRFGFDLNFGTNLFSDRN